MSSPHSNTLNIFPFSTHNPDPKSSTIIQSPSSNVFLTNSLTATNLNDHPMITQSKAGILKPKTFTSHTDLHFSIHATVIEALHSPHWFQAMTDEYDDLIKNKMWILTSLPVDPKL